MVHRRGSPAAGIVYDLDSKRDWWKKRSGLGREEEAQVTVIVFAARRSSCSSAAKPEAQVRVRVRMRVRSATSGGLSIKKSRGSRLPVTAKLPSATGAQEGDRAGGEGYSHTAHGRRGESLFNRAVRPEREPGEGVQGSRGPL